MPSDSGSATTIATSAISTVPTMTAAMPKPPPSGFQSWVVMKLKPALCSAVQAR